MVISVPQICPSVLCPTSNGVCPFPRSQERKKRKKRKREGEVEGEEEEGGFQPDSQDSQKTEVGDVEPLGPYL